MDITRPLEMTLHRRLAYHLYPINIRNHPDGDKLDCLILFAKKNAIEHIPDDYVIRYQYDAQNILAVRREIP